MPIGCGGLVISFTNGCNYRKLSGETTDKRGRMMTMQLPCSGNLKSLLLRRRITSAESLAGTNCAWPEDLHCNYKFVEQGEEYSGFIVCTNTRTRYAEHAFYHDGLDKILCCAREDEM